MYYMNSKKILYCSKSSSVMHIDEIIMHTEVKRSRRWPALSNVSTYLRRLLGKRIETFDLSAVSARISDISSFGPFTQKVVVSKNIYRIFECMKVFFDGSP